MPINHTFSHECPNTIPPGNVSFACRWELFFSFFFFECSRDPLRGRARPGTSDLMEPAAGGGAKVKKYKKDKKDKKDKTEKKEKKEAKKKARAAEEAREAEEARKAAEAKKAEEARVAEAAR